MPAKAKVTKEMIVEAAFAVARETGAETSMQEPYRKGCIALHSSLCIILPRLKN